MRTQAPGICWGFSGLYALECSKDDRLRLSDHGSFKPGSHVLALEKLIALGHVRNDQVSGFLRKSL
jgi:hypothetical protein